MRWIALVLLPGAFLLAACGGTEKAGPTTDPTLQAKATNTPVILATKTPSPPTSTPASPPTSAPMPPAPTNAVAAPPPETWSPCKTYENKEYAYKLTCLAGMEVLEARPRLPELQEATFRTPGLLECVVRVVSNSENLTLTEWIAENSSSNEQSQKPLLLSPVQEATLAGMPAKELVIFAFDENITAIVALRNGYIYEIEYRNTQGNPNFSQEQQKSQQMCVDLFSTFAFL